jgi:ABC-2 type transport system ATP-binding protein
MPIDGLRPGGPGGIRASKVSRSFAGRAVLRGIDLDVGSGSMVSVIGGNGSGKSTLLRLLAGVLTPDEGEIEIAGMPPGTGATRLVPAGDRMLNWRLTGSQNLSFFARLSGIASDSLEASVGKALEALDAGPLASRRVGECSTGQRRRLMIAAGFVSRAPVLLLDEPMEDLDREGRAAVERICSSWTEDGGSVLAAAPDMDALPPATHHLVLGPTVGEGSS